MITAEKAIFILVKLQRKTPIHKNRGNEDFEALAMGMDALIAIDAIKRIINSDLPIQEDVMRYKMICEIVKGDSDDKAGR